MKFPSSLSRKINSRKAEGIFRTLSPNDVGIDFFSNDYLGFARNANIAAQTELLSQSLQLSNGSSGSRLISGNSIVHEELERELAGFFHSESALLYNSGYDANLGLLSAILQRGDTIFYDRLSHASIRDGIGLSKAKAYSFEHNSIEDLKKKVQQLRSSNGQNFVVVESVYSMDGDESPLIQLADFCLNQELYLIVDEAHATGVFGKFGQGLVAEKGLTDMVFARIHTFGKAMGCQGAVVLGAELLRDYLINFSRSFIYTTAMPPSEALRIGVSLKELQHTVEIDKLQKVIQEFLGLISAYGMTNHFVKSQSAIQSFLLPDSGRASEIINKLAEKEIGAKVIFSPTVAKGEERIRICLHSYNTSEDIQRILQLLSTFV